MAMVRVRVDSRLRFIIVVVGQRWIRERGAIDNTINVKSGRKILR